MANHTAFIRRITDLTRNSAVIWSGTDGPEYVAHVDSYTAHLVSVPVAGPRGDSGLRFTLFNRKEKVLEIGARTADFHSSDDSGPALRALYEAVTRQQASRETAVFEDFLSRVEA